MITHYIDIILHYLPFANAYMLYVLVVNSNFNTKLVKDKLKKEQTK
jgi:hypothetical protein